MRSSAGGVDDIKTKENPMLILAGTMACTFALLTKAAFILAGTVLGVFAFMLVAGTLISLLVATTLGTP